MQHNIHRSETSFTFILEWVKEYIVILGKVAADEAAMPVIEELNIKDIDIPKYYVGLCLNDKKLQC